MSAGSANHLHMSLWRDSLNIMPVNQEILEACKQREPTQNDISPEAQYFVNGILTHLPGLMAITLPTHNSYDRLSAHCWAGVRQAWGFENRECPLRIACAPAPNNFELKAIDNTAQPYLTLAYVLIAGMAGLRDALLLPPPSIIDPALDLDSRALPSLLAFSVEAFRNDPVLRIPDETMHLCITELRSAEMLVVKPEAEMKKLLLVRF